MSASTPKTKSAPAKKNAGGNGGKTSAMRVKRILRATRPKFLRHAHYRKGEVKPNWRKPRGLHNKQKDNKKNRLPSVSDGYRTPESVRGLHISGLAIAHVANVGQLTGLDKETHGVVVSAVGAKKQLAILEACGKQGLRVLNHNADERMKLIKDRQTARKDAAEATRKEKASKEEETKKSSKKSKQPVEETLSEEEKKARDEKIKEEVLTEKGQ